MRILRFKLDDGKTVIGMPPDARVLSVAVKPGDGSVSLWALCPNGEPTGPVRRAFQVVGTGWKVELPADAIYLGTAIEVTPGFEPGRPQTFCWHVFELPALPP